MKQDVIDYGEASPNRKQRRWHTQEQGITLSHASLVEGLEAGGAALHMLELAPPEGPLRQAAGPLWTVDCHLGALHCKWCQT